MPLDGVLAANNRDTHRNTQPKSGLPLQEFAPATNAIPTSVPIKIPIVTGVLQPPRCDGNSFVRGGCNTPLTKEFQPLPLDGVLAANHRDTYRNTKPKSGLPLQEFAPATNAIPTIEILIGNLSAGGENAIQRPYALAGVCCN